MAAECTAPLTLGTLRVTVDATKRTSIRTLQQQFGDGYRARRPDGINTLSEEWQVSTRPMRRAEADALEGELVALGPAPFTWTPPHESTPKQWILDPVQWSTEYPTENAVTLSFTLKRWYG